MKKNSFIGGTIIATLGIIITKIIGLLYVIPFYAIIGDQGGALYGYAYTVYQLFLSLSTAGFPFAISKLTSEYLALEETKAAKDVYYISRKLILILSLVIFVILFVFAPQIGRIIIGERTSGNTYEDIAFVIRCVSFAVLVIPFLSASKGFLQGHRNMTTSAVSQVIEQVVRVAVILLGSYVAMKIFNMSLTQAVGIAVFGAFLGGLAAYIYLRIKLKKSKLLEEKNDEEVRIEKKEIIKKLFKYSIPYILISLVYNLYNVVDMVLISRTLSDILHYDNTIIDTVISIYTTWGMKINMIILALSTGLVTSLIPNIVNNYTKKDTKKLNLNINKAVQYVLLIIVPITIFLSLLAKPVWTMFYGKSTLGPVIYQFFVYAALFGSFYTISVSVLQGLSKYRLVIKSVLIGLLTNTLLDVPLMILFDKLGMNASYGAILAQLIGFSLAVIISISNLAHEGCISFKSTLKKIPTYLYSWGIFIISILVLKLFIPINLSSRIIQIPILILFGVVSFGIYFYISYLNGNLTSVCDIKKIKDKILKKIKKS